MSERLGFCFVGTTENAGVKNAARYDNAENAGVEWYGKPLVFKITKVVSAK